MRLPAWLTRFKPTTDTATSTTAATSTSTVTSTAGMPVTQAGDDLDEQWHYPGNSSTDPWEHWTGLEHPDTSPAGTWAGDVWLPAADPTTHIDAYANTHGDTDDAADL